jgi:hypothetical protein
MQSNIRDLGDYSGTVRVVSLVNEKNGGAELYTNWNVIIGSYDRLSLIDQVGVAFRSLDVPPRSSL